MPAKAEPLATVLHRFAAAFANDAGGEATLHDAIAEATDTAAPSAPEPAPEPVVVDDRMAWERIPEGHPSRSRFEPRPAAKAKAAK